MSTPAKISHPLLVKYLAQISQHPLRTKIITSGTLCFLQEVLGSNLSSSTVNISKDASVPMRALSSVHINARAFKMAIYGFLVSAPLSHFLVGQLQKAFAGRTSTRAKIAQTIASNLLVAPINTSSYLACMAIINGATSLDEIIKTIKAGFFSVIRVTWVVSPLSMTIAQNFLPVELWVPFFNLIQFVLGTYFNTRAKILKLAIAKEKEEREKQEREKRNNDRQT